jgi:hypothetical protein
MAQFNFDMENTAPDSGFELIPDGTYTLMATEAEEKQAAKAGSTYLSVIFEFLEEHAGRKIWQNFTMTNNSQKAQDIGHGQLKAWAMACNQPSSNDSDQLLNVAFQAVIGTEKGNDGYADSNQIMNFKFKQEANTPSKPVSNGKFEDPSPTPPVAPATPPATVKAPAAPAQTESANPWDV